MNQYRVELSYRPNVNSLKRVNRLLAISAPNKEAALVLAGNRTGLLGEGMIAESVRVSIRRMKPTELLR